MLDIDSVTIVYINGVMTDMKMLDPSEYKREFSKLIQTLLDTPKDAMPSQECRLMIAGMLPEMYYDKMEEYPNQYDLKGLADYCMLSYIKSVNKKKSDENSFHSDKQAQRRSAREYLVSTNDSLLDFLYSKYTLNMDSLAKKNSMEVDN